MPALYVFEDSQWDRLAPLTYPRAACELRVGALTLFERIARVVGHPLAGALVRSAVADGMRRRNPGLAVNPALSARDGIILINGRWLALNAARAGGKEWPLPDPDSAALQHGVIVWIHLSPELAGKIDLSKLSDARTLETILPDVRRMSSNVPVIGRPWDLLDHQKAAIEEDFAAMGPLSDATVMPGAHLLNPARIHLARGTKIWPGAVLDASGGPIILGEESEVRANAVITGPVALGAHTVIRNHADIREECSFGPGCRIGGEVIGTILLGNANKQHHGFLGQSSVAEWANLGAGTTTSNVKNTYGQVRIPLNGNEESTGRLFMGSIIADHVKLGIGTYLSTGSVVGFGSHVVVPRPPRFVPSFAWLTDKGMQRADFEKLEQVAATVMKRRNLEFTPGEHELWVRIASEYATQERFTWPEG